MAAWGLGCVGPLGGWDVDALVEAHPALGEIPRQRLGDASPYFRPVLDEAGVQLELVLCRWPSASRVWVSLPDDATASERGQIEAALRAWNGVDLGVVLVEAGSDGADTADIRIRFAAEHDAERGLVSALTGANCAVSNGAVLHDAEVALYRHNLDVLGRPVPLDPDAFVGTALHDLGHALGFQGHVARRDAIMTREVERVRDVGERVRAGGQFESPALRALYAIPSGTAVGRLGLDEASARRLRQLSERAARTSWRGPFVRVGDRSARIFWREGDDGEVALGVLDWRAAVRAGEPVRLVPNRRALDHLLGRASAR